MEELREIDQVAYVRFASVYRSFRDVSEFMTELSQLLDIPSKKIRRKKPKKRNGSKGKKVASAKSGKK